MLREKRLLSLFDARYGILNSVREQNAWALSCACGARKSCCGG
jgi:hypothetical protein